MSNSTNFSPDATESLDDFEFLTIGLLSAPLHKVGGIIEKIVLEKFPRGRFTITSRPLDIRSVCWRRPRPGGAHERRAVLFEPAGSTGTTALIANMEDGWLTMCNVLAGRIPGEHVLARSCIDRHYPLTDFEVWEDGESVRYVRAFREDPSWEFFARGKARSFEDATNYKKRKIADRLNRLILIEYLRKLGWDLRSPDFWRSNLLACYLQEVR